MNRIFRVGDDVRVDHPADPLDGMTGSVAERLSDGRIVVEFAWEVALSVMGLGGRKAPEFPFLRIYPTASLWTEDEMAAHFAEVHG